MRIKDITIGGPQRSTRVIMAGWDVIARLGVSIDPEQKWVMVRSPRSIRTPKLEPVMLKTAESGQSYCNHHHERSVLQAWLVGLSAGQPLCPRCARALGHGRGRGRRHVSSPVRAQVASNKNEEREEAEVEEVPPAFLDNCIKWYFAPRVFPPSELVMLRASGIPGAGEGAFARVEIEANDQTSLGVYGGRVMYRQAEADASLSDKIMTFDLWNNTVHVDGTNSWHGKINHQWEWPYDKYTNQELSGMGLYRKQPLPEWLGVFANVDVGPNGVVFTPRKVLAGEELTVDYGLEFWSDKTFKPRWDLRGLRILPAAQLRDEMSRDPLLKNLEMASDILWPLGIVIL